ncbi:hypothetical protein, partial [Uliginosibacterium gangwonense]|uniref:hypothetical protein n=1 Tax=Uliginosibacterium gangwonense TaxID=392736 RepID=UPI0005271E77
IKLLSSIFFTSSTQIHLLTFGVEYSIILHAVLRQRLLIKHSHLSVVQLFKERLVCCERGAFYTPHIQSQALCFNYQQPAQLFAKPHQIYILLDSALRCRCLFA